MKKLSVLLIFALLLAVFAGCQATEPQEQLVTPTYPIARMARVGLELPLTKQAAIQLALNHVGVPNEQVQHLHARRDQDGDAYHYDVDFRHGDYYYAYEISEETGEILSLETEHDRTELPETQIPKEEAVKIALTHEEFTETDVTDLTATFDSEDHRYEVEFVRDGIRYTYEICAEFGKILDIDKEPEINENNS